MDEIVRWREKEEQLHPGSREILLVLDIFVGGNEYIEPFIRTGEQLAIF